MSTSPVWLITGTSRGIGLEIVRQVSTNAESTVFAAVRNPQNAPALQKVKEDAKGTVHILQLDINSEESIMKAAKEVEQILGGRGVDYLVNNAGIMAAGDDWDKAFSFSRADLMSNLETNVVGPALTGKYFVDLISKSEAKTIANMSSGVGSIGAGLGEINSSYAISKMALNMLTYKQATSRPDLKVISVDPGWVKTEMGGPGAEITVQTSVKGVISLVEGLTTEQSGKAFTYQGKELPW